MSRLRTRSHTRRGFLQRAIRGLVGVDRRKPSAAEDPTRGKAPMPLPGEPGYRDPDSYGSLADHN